MYSLPARHLIRADGFTVYSRAGDGQLGTQIGDQMVMAAAQDRSGLFVASVFQRLDDAESVAVPTASG